jgi:hypothetical protein
MSDKNSSNKQRTFLFNLNYTGGNNQHKNNYEHLELIYQFYASAISNSNFVIENFKRCEPYTGEYIRPTYSRLQSVISPPEDKDKKEEGDKQKSAKNVNQSDSNEITSKK